jgi:flagellar L-ring protein precursor FlgH
VGDVITIDIVENTSSKMDANTKAGRTSSIDGSIDNSLGYMRALQEANRRLGLNLDATASNTLFKATLKNEFDGKGTSDRSGQVTASIGARVTEVLPNGNLIIFGKRKMKVNNETQIITVSGIIRPADIDTDNRIKSTYIADALIEYTGQGVIAEKQKPGWGSRVVDIIWPF